MLSLRILLFSNEREREWISMGREVRVKLGRTEGRKTVIEVLYEKDNLVFNKIGRCELK